MEKTQIWIGTKEYFWWDYKMIFWEEKVKTLQKIIQILKIRTCFMQIFMAFHKEKVFDSKAWGLIWGLMPERIIRP